MTLLRLELVIDRDDAARVGGVLGLARPAAKTRRPSQRPVPCRIIWHDSSDAALANQGFVLAEHRHGRIASFRLERLRADADRNSWSPAAPPSILAQGGDVAALAAELVAMPSSMPLLEGLVPIAAFEGHTRAITVAQEGGSATISTLLGSLRAVAGERPVARLLIEGEAAEVTGSARRLTGALRAMVPATCLAAEAYGVARVPLPAVSRGAPEPPAHLSPADALEFIIARLTAAILHHAPAASLGVEPEAVHQMRVAMRRLRSALKLAAKSPERPDLSALSTDLKALGRVLGPPRDWDVFTNGTLHDVVAALPDDAALRQLAASAKRQRGSAYADLRSYLDSSAFRQLGLSLSLFSMTPAHVDSSAIPLAPANPPSAGGDDRVSLETVVADIPVSASGEVRAPQPAPPTEMHAFAARALDKYRKRLRTHGPAVHELEPNELHDIRLDAKRLRYVAEFFAPLYPGRNAKRFLRRLADLQEQLGHLNDGVTTAALLARVGYDRRFAGGIVRGFVAASSAQARKHIDRTWRKFRRQDAFWK